MYGFLEFDILTNNSVFKIFSIFLHSQYDSKINMMEYIISWLTLLLPICYVLVNILHVLSSLIIMTPRISDYF